ncbi:hypothetical protein DSECCO2_531800 [anaerobic digester metagenome]
MDRHLFVGKAGDDDHGHMRCHGPDLDQGSEPIAVREIQVEQDSVERLFTQESKCVGKPTDRNSIVPFGVHLC